MRKTTHSPAAFKVDTSCRQLFNVLDGRPMVAAKQPWQITVFGVVDDGVSRWVQMMLSGKAVSEVTIRMDSGEGGQPVIRALAQWLNATLQGDPHVPEIVSTARCA